MATVKAATAHPAISTQRVIARSGSRASVHSDAKPEKRHEEKRAQNAAMGLCPTSTEAVEFENQRNRSNGIAGGAAAARHLLNATREIEIARRGQSEQFQGFKD